MGNVSDAINAAIEPGSAAGMSLTSAEADAIIRQARSNDGLVSRPEVNDAREFVDQLQQAAAETVLEETGQSLNPEEITPEAIRRMASHAGDQGPSMRQVARTLENAMRIRDRLEDTRDGQGFLENMRTLINDTVRPGGPTWT